MGFSFLTPYAALFALTAAIPIAALLRMEDRARRLRSLFSLAEARRRDLVTAAVALTLLPALLAVAAAQPVVIRKETLTQRVDTQVFLVFDTSLSMSARNGPTSPTRLERSKREAEALVPRLGSIPVGIATLTDRILPNLMPTTNAGLATRTINQSVQINEPRPSVRYRGRASTLQALIPDASDGLFSPGVKHPVVVIFTDGEERRPPAGIGFTCIAEQVTIPPLFVHVWGPRERIYVDGQRDPYYRPDPTSGHVLREFAAATHGQVLREGDVGGLLDAIRGEAGSNPAQTTTLGYARVALAPWFLLAGVLPLAFLIYRRNF